MYIAVTRNIQIVVMPQFVAERSEPDEGRFFWAYTIEITNLGRDTVRLIGRHWIITDANGVVEEVQGPGVVGEQPVIPPGESFRYTSGCPLTTPSGIMVGSYHMLDGSGHPFEVDIPAFSLDSPFSRRVLN